MTKPLVIAGLIAAAFAGLPAAASAQSLETKHYNYSEWTKGRFSEAVTVTGPGKMIFLAGVGAEDENGKGGDILYKGDWCSTTNSPATTDCHDAVSLAATFAASSVKINN